jgi:hypothetical protein
MFGTKQQDATAAFPRPSGGILGCERLKPPLAPHLICGCGRGRFEPRLSLRALERLDPQPVAVDHEADVAGLERGPQLLDRVVDW